MSASCLRSFRAFLTAAGILATACASLAAEPARLELSPGHKIVLIGNALAERMQYDGYWESRCCTAGSRSIAWWSGNLGWTGDELTVRLRSKDFQNHGHRLEDHQPDVVIAAFGFNESFGGPAGLPKFKSDLDNFIRENDLDTASGGKSPPQLVLVSPIAHENLKRHGMPDGRRNNENLKLYTEAIGAAADKHHLVFVDLFGPSLHLMQAAAEPLTINGIHLSPAGDQQMAAVLDAALFGPRSAETVDLERLRAEINEKNLQFFYDYRAVNGYYIYGDRKNDFSAVSFPPEFAKLKKMVGRRDERVWAVAQGQGVSAKIDDSDTGELPVIETVLTAEQAVHPQPRRNAENVYRGGRLPDQSVRFRGRVSRPARSGGHHVRRPRPAVGGHDGHLSDVPARRAGRRSDSDLRGATDGDGWPATSVTALSAEGTARADLGAWNWGTAGCMSPSSRTWSF